MFKMFLSSQSTNTMLYRCALIKPIKLGFNTALTSGPFLDISKSFFLQRPVRVPWELQCCLDKVHDLLKSDKFSVNLNLEDLTLKTIFLLVLASGGRASEINSLFRKKGQTVFNHDFKCVFVQTPRVFD